MEDQPDLPAFDWKLCCLIWWHNLWPYGPLTVQKIMEIYWLKWNQVRSVNCQVTFLAFVLVQISMWLCVCVSVSVWVCVFNLLILSATKQGKVCVCVSVCLCVVFFLILCATKQINRKKCHLVLISKGAPFPDFAVEVGKSWCFTKLYQSESQPAWRAGM